MLQKVLGSAENGLKLATAKDAHLGDISLHKLTCSNFHELNEMYIAEKST